MEAFTSIAAWATTLRADVEAAEWSWRGLDETEPRAGNMDVGIRNVRAKEERGTEVSRLRAQLVVVTFLQGLQAEGRADEKNAVTVQVDLDGDRYDVASRLGFAMLTQTDVDSGAEPRFETCWRAIASKVNAATGHWWISLEASSKCRGREMSRHRFRFKVVEDHVEGWLGVAESSLQPELDRSSPQ